MLNLEQFIGQACGMEAGGHAGMSGEPGIFSIGVRDLLCKAFGGPTIPLLGVILLVAGPAWGLLPDPSCGLVLLVPITSEQDRLMSG